MARRLILKNTLAQISTLTIVKGSAFLLGVVAARFWDVGTFGSYQFVLALSGLFTFMSTLGVNLLLVRELARRPPDADEQVGNALGLTAGLAVAGLAVASLILPVLPQGPRMAPALLLAVAGVGVMGMNSVLAAAAHAAERMEVETWITALERLVFLTGGLSVLLAGLGMVPLLAVSLAAHAVAGAAYLRATARQGLLVRPRWDWPIIRTLARRSLPFGVNLILSNIYIQIDVLMLAYLSGSVEVGIYAAATSFILPMSTLATTFNRSLFPRLSRYLGPQAREQEMRNAKGLSDRAIRWLLLVGVPIGAGLGFLAEEAVRLIYGARYAAAAPLVRLMAAVVPLKFLSNAYATLLTSGDRQEMRTLCVFMAAALNVGLNSFMIPWWGAWGAAAATLITESVLFAVLHLYVRKVVRNLALVRPALVPLMGSACMVLVILVTRGWHVLAAAALAGTIYLLIVYLFDRGTLAELIS